MYSDANLPEEEAWIAMSKDLRQTKEARNNLTKANSYVVDAIAELIAKSSRTVI
jgi:protein ECT2